jgi:hypothetical protein
MMERISASLSASSPLSLKLQLIHSVLSSPHRSSYQVAMERAQIFLNLLDIVWGEIVAAGGLVERGSKDDVH